MKAKCMQKRWQAKAAAPAPGIDEIITISRDSGKPKLELRKAEDVAVQRKEAKTEPNTKEQQKQRGFRLPRKPESKIQTRKPKADVLKESTPEPKTITKKERSVASESTPEPKTAAPSSAALSESKTALAEAALFLSSKPLMLDELAKIMGVNSLGYVKESLESLMSQYEGRGIEVVSSAAGWQMQVRPGYLNAVAHLAPYADLSEGPKRALALILFKEPMKQSDLIKMQGNKVYDYLKTLEKMGMIRREPCGRTKTLILTKEFERYFGEEKEKIKERLAQELAAQKPAEVSKSKDAPKLNAKAELKKIAAEMNLEEDVE